MNKSFLHTLIHNELAVKFKFPRKKAQEVAASLTQTFVDAGWIADAPSESTGKAVKAA